MNKNLKNKILCIKFFDGKTHKEIQTDSREITIGRDIENTISISDPSIPNKLLLFEKKEKNFHLLITEKIKDAYITVDDSTLRIHDLITHALLPRSGGSAYSYLIGPACEGTVCLNDIKLTFFLCDAPPPPPPPPKQTIPKEFRRKLFNREDLGFINILILSLAIHATAAVIFETVKVPEPDITNIKKIPRRFAKLILGVTSKQLKEITKPKVEKKKKKEEVVEKEEKKPEEKPKEEKPKEEPKKEEPKKEEKLKEAPEAVEKKKAPVKTEAQKRMEARAKRREKLKTKGVLAMLVGKKAGKGKRKTVSHFIGNKSVSQNLDKVLAGLGGLRNIKPTIKKKSKEEQAVGIDNLIAKITEEETAKIKTVKLKKQKRANIKKLFDMEGSGAGDPKRSKEVIGGVVQTYLGGLKYLYDRELRKDPTLEGKLVVQFTILANGKISNCFISSSTMNNQRFGKSVLKRVRRWRFEPIEEGEVVVTYPFVFFPVITG